MFCGLKLFFKELGERKTHPSKFLFQRSTGIQQSKRSIKTGKHIFKAFSGFSAVQSEFARHGDLTMFHNLETKAGHTLDDFQFWTDVKNMGDHKHKENFQPH